MVGNGRELYYLSYHTKFYVLRGIFPKLQPCRCGDPPPPQQKLKCHTEAAMGCYPKQYNQIPVILALAGEVHLLLYNAR